MRTRIDFLTTPSGIPLDSDILDFMQQGYTEAINVIAGIAGSDDVIVSGCQRAGDQVSAGWLYVGGDLVRFLGGDAGATERIKISEVAQTLENQNGQEVDRLFTQTAAFDADGSFSFSDLRRAGTLLELQRRAAGLVAFEPAVIVEGCDVSGVAGSSLTIGSGVYVLDGQFVASAPYSGSFPVYFSAASGYTTADPGGTRVAFDPYTSQRKADVIARAGVKAGELREVAADILDQFGPDGRGKWAWSGYALADGRNNTADLRGRFRVGYHATDADYNSVGATGGASQVTLTVAQMPRHNHGSSPGEVLPPGEAGLIFKSVAGTDTTVGQSDDGNAGQEPDVKTDPVPIPSEGGNAPHENRPPYFVTIVVQRL